MDKQLRIAGLIMFLAVLCTTRATPWRTISVGDRLFTGMGLTGFMALSITCVINVGKYKKFNYQFFLPHKSSN